MIHIDANKTINIKRLKRRMNEMAMIGLTDKGGVSRLALTKEDQKARNLFLHWMTDLGLQTRFDDVGNIYGRLEGKDPKAAPVLLGSHLDSVPKGGKFDGTLGVLAALEVVETIIEANIEPIHPIEIVSFTNEEGARFTPQMLGSGVITGKFSKPYVYDREDLDGHVFQNELQEIGFLGKEENRPTNIKAFLELHIEQGPTLEQEDISVGVVEGIKGFYWLEITVSGQSDHAGSTPMHMRQDSLVAASSIISNINQWATKKNDSTVATVGQIRTSPGIINAIPGETTFTLDIRHPDPHQLETLITEVTSLIQDASGQNQVQIKEISFNEPVSFSPKIIDLLQNVCKNLNYPYKRMRSGAGHDAMYLNKVTDTAMIFVPSTNGKSHCEEEHTSYTDIEKGVNTLYQTICQLI